MAMSNDDLLRALLPMSGATPQAPPVTAPAAPVGPDLGLMLGFGAPPAPVQPNLGVAGLAPPVMMPSTAASQQPLALASGTPSLGSLTKQEAAGVAQQQAGIQAEAAAKGQLAQTVGEGDARAAAEQRSRLEADAAANAQADASIAARRQQLYDQADALGAQRIDPSRLYANMSTPQKIAGAIAIALGGFSAGVTHGQNVPLAIIQKQIDNDVQAQMAELENRRAALGAKSTLLQSEIAQGRNAADARHQLTVALYDNAINEVKAQAAMLGTDQAKAEAQRLQGKLLTDVADKDKAFWTQQRGLELQGAHLGIAQKQLQLDTARFGLQVAKEAEDAPLHAAETQAKIAEAQMRLAVLQGKVRPDAPEKAIFAIRDPATGLPFQAPDKERATAANQIVGEAQKGVSALDRLIELRQQNGAELDNPVVKTEAAKRMDAAMQSVVGALKAQFGTRFTEAEAEIIKKQIGDSATSFRDNTAAWQEMREKLVRDTGQYLHANVGYQGAWTPEAITVPGERRDTIAPTAPVGAPAARGLPPAPAAAAPPDSSQGVPLRLPTMQFPPQSWFQR